MGLAMGGREGGGGGRKERKNVKRMEVQVR